MRLMIGRPPGGCESTHQRREVLVVTRAGYNHSKPLVKHLEIFHKKTESLKVSYTPNVPQMW